MYIAATSLHTCDHTITLIIERLLHIQINSPYISFISVHKVMYTICKAYILIAYEKEHDHGSNRELSEFSFLLFFYVITLTQLNGKSCMIS